MVPRLLGALAAFGFCAVVVAHASSLAVTPRTFGSGVASVAACDTNGFAFKYTIDTSGHITTVSVSDIALACAGGTLRLTLTNSAASVGSGSVALPSSGFSGTASVSVSPTPLSSNVTATYADVEGP